MLNSKYISNVYNNIKSNTLHVIYPYEQILTNTCGGCDGIYFGKLNDMYEIIYRFNYNLDNILDKVNKKFGLTMAHEKIFMFVVYNFI